MSASGVGELCGHRWLIMDEEASPGDQEGVLEGMAVHRCARALGHFGPHRCPHDGAEVER